MKASLLVFFLAILAGATFALTLGQPSVRAASCSCGFPDSITCATHFEGIANAGQGQNCCSPDPSTFPTEHLKFTITRNLNSSCKRSLLIRTSTGGSTCSIGSDYEPQPSAGIQTCWNGSNPRSHTETYYMQRCCDITNGTLTVEVQQMDTTKCAEITGTFNSAQTALCSNCTNPGTCQEGGMCFDC